MNTKYIPHAVIAAIVLLFIVNKSCNNTSSEDGEKKIIKKEIQKAKKEADGVSIKRDSLKEVIKDLQQDLQEAKAREKAAEKKSNKVITEIKKKSFLEAVAFLKNRYKTENVSSTEESLELKKEVPGLVATELEEKDSLSKKVTLQKEVIKAKDNTIVKQDTLLRKTMVGLSLAEEEIVKRKEENSYYADLTEVQEKQIKKQKRRSFVDKLITVGVGFLGYLIGSNGK
jgi:hypothetical protein